MCVAVPAQITGIRHEGAVKVAIVAMPGASGEHELSLAMLPDAEPGDWIVAHSGFAITLLSEEEAREALALFAADPLQAQLPDS